MAQKRRKPIAKADVSRMQGNSDFNFRKLMIAALERPEATEYEPLLGMLNVASIDALLFIKERMHEKYEKYNGQELPQSMTREFLEDLIVTLQEAQEACSNAIEESPDFSDSSSKAIACSALAKMSFYEGEILREAGKHPEAASCYRDAVRYNERNDYFHYRLAAALMMEKRYADAKGPLLRAIELSKDNADYHALLGIAYKESKEINKAIGAFTLSLNLDPTHEPAKIALEELKKVKTSGTYEKVPANLTGPLVAPSLPKPTEESAETVSQTESTLSSANKVRIQEPPPAVLPKKTKTKKLYKQEESASKGPPLKPIYIIAASLLIAIGAFLMSSNPSAPRVDITPLKPDNKSFLEYAPVEFRWNCTAENVDYLLEIEEGGKKILERYTRERIYVLSRDDMKKLEPEIWYKWRIVPISPKRQAIDYTTIDREFMLEEVSEKKK